MGKTIPPKYNWKELIDKFIIEKNIVNTDSQSKARFMLELIIQNKSELIIRGKQAFKAYNIDADLNRYIRPYESEVSNEVHEFDELIASAANLLKQVIQKTGDGELFGERYNDELSYTWNGVEVYYSTYYQDLTFDEYPVEEKDASKIHALIEHLIERLSNYPVDKIVTIHLYRYRNGSNEPYIEVEGLPKGYDCEVVEED